MLLRQSSHQGHGSNGAISSTSPYTSFARSYFPFTSRPLKPAKLTLTPHHLFYLLSRFEELGIAVGPMNIRLEDLHTETSPSNYVSFLNNAQRRKIQNSDRDSIHSVSSIRSVMSSMTVLWSSLGLSSKSQAKSDKHKAVEKDELKYLYSAFTKVPCLKLAPDHRAPLIRGYEEFPFDSAVPLFAFKNLTALEICDVDFRQFYGWDRVADQIRSLTVKRAKVDDPTDLLINIVLDDMDKRRKRSSKLPTTPPAPLPAGSPKLKRQESVSSRSAHSSPPRDKRRNSDELIGLGVSVNSRGSPHPRRRSASPSRPSVSRQGLSHGSGRKSTSRLRRSSGSSGSSAKTSTPRGSSTSLLSQNYLPSSKWRFLHHLSLTDNSLTHLTAVSLAPVANTLQSLDLSHNLFTEIPDSLATLVSLRALNLSHCMIESLHSLVRNPLPAITVVNLRANRLSSLAGIERLLSLERIDIRENKLTDPTETARLTCIPNMVDIYVNKNPFVRNYSNYRITIFNLFRKTPGYTDDIFIDGTQPVYSERKHLVDRALEQAKPAIVKLMEDRSISPTPVAFEAPTTPPTFVIGDQDQKTSRSNEYGQGTQKKKKGPRRRVVDIAQAETASSPEPRPDPLRLEPSPLPPPAFEQLQRPIVKKSATMASPPSQASTHRSPDMVEPFPPIDTTFSPPILRTGSDPTSLPTLNTEGDTYRKKIEALRNDFGSGWLSALNDDTWDSHQRPAGFDGTFNPLGPPTGPVRTASQGIVSGARTLG